jgi:hypothetical protein
VRGRKPHGYRVHWDHPNGRDKMCGELWPDRDTAEYVSATVREAGMLNVRIVPAQRMKGGSIHAA